MIFHNEKFDIIVIGAGHAAVEAALAPARMGLKTLMLTLDPEKIGQMSCNPAIGGIAKGQVVREIDALGGEMARATDKAAIQYRMLNRSKGPAVWSPRAQADRDLYRRVMVSTVTGQPNLAVHTGEVVDILVDNRKAVGVIDSQGIAYKSRSVVLCSGTFLCGLLHCGLDSVPGGRRGEPPARHLSSALRRLGFEVGRLKTGTPMRLDGRSINYAKCEMQPGDPHPLPFSHFTIRLPQKQIPCWLAYTNQRTHEIIRNNLDRSPIYSGKIDTTGVRYCPSIEDKIVKFPHHERHHIFVEPEGYFTDEVYINGLFTSLPGDVQEKMVRTIPGFEDAKFIRYGYAVEYDYCPPTQVQPTLETKLIENLYFAGQINGTTGYEEAAGQGLVAGINAALKLREEPPLILGRDEAYIGVMIDDLVTKGVDEPYRLLTSRAEYRLHLRWDNAHLRLMPYGRRVGLINQETFDDFQLFRHDVHARLSDKNTLGSPMAPFHEEDPLRTFDLAKGPWSEEHKTYQIWVQHKYGGYLKRQETEIARFRQLENKRIPPEIDYHSIPGLLLEAREKLSRVRPVSLGQASRIPGLTPSDISILLVTLKRTANRVPRIASRFSVRDTRYGL